MSDARVSRYLAYAQNLMRDSKLTASVGPDLSWLLKHVNQELFAALVASKSYPELLKSDWIAATEITDDNARKAFDGLVAQGLTIHNSLPKCFCLTIEVAAKDQDARAKRWVDMFKAHPTMKSSEISRRAVALIEFPEMRVLSQVANNKEATAAVAFLLSQLLSESMYTVAMGAFVQESKDVVIIPPPDAFKDMKVQPVLDGLLELYGQRAPFPYDKKYLPSLKPRGDSTVSTTALADALQAIPVSATKLEASVNVLQLVERTLSLNAQRQSDAAIKLLKMEAVRNSENTGAQEELLQQAIRYGPDEWLVPMGESIRAKNASALLDATEAATEVIAQDASRPSGYEMIHCYAAIVAKAHFPEIYSFIRLFTIGTRYLRILRKTPLTNWKMPAFHELNKLLYQALESKTGDQAAFTRFTAVRDNPAAEPALKLSEAETLATTISKEAPTPDSWMHDARVSQALLAIDRLAAQFPTQVSKLHDVLRSGYPQRAHLVPALFLQSKRIASTTAAVETRQEEDVKVEPAPEPVKSLSASQLLLAGLIKKGTPPEQQKAPTVLEDQLHALTRQSSGKRLNLAQRMKVLPSVLSTADKLALRTRQYELEQTYAILQKERDAVIGYADVPKVILYGRLGQQIWNRAPLDVKGDVSSRMTERYLRRYFAQSPPQDNCTYVWFGTSDANYIHLDKVPGYSTRRKTKIALSPEQYEEKLCIEAAQEAHYRLVEIHDDDSEAITNAAQGFFTPSLLLPSVNRESMQIVAEELDFHSRHLIDRQHEGRVIVVLLKDRFYPQLDVPPIRANTTAEAVSELLNDDGTAFE